MKWRDTIGALSIALALCVTAAPAQDQKQNSQSASPGPSSQSGDSMGSDTFGRPPAAAARGVSPAYDPQTQPYDPAQVVPDTNTLSGAQLFSVGSLGRAHNIFDPAISISQLGQTVPGINGQTSLMSTTLFGGSLNFDRTWSLYHLTAIYNVGETFDGGALNSHQQYHDMNIAYQMEWARWHLLLRDDFTASPGAAFTGGGMGGPGLAAQYSSMLNASLNSVGQAFSPSETIETGNAMRYRNMVLGQAEYSFSRRSAFTVAASYGLLHYTSLGFISSNMLNVQAGYDYLLDPANSVAILASYGKISYTGTANSTTDYTAAFAYGRKITGRLAFQAAAGPQLIRPVGGAQNFQQWSLSVNSSLNYGRRRGGASLSYARGLDSGSGVFLGAKTDTFSGSAHYQLSRFWTGMANTGYAMNHSLVPYGGISTAFNNWFIGGGLNHRLTRHAQFGLSYSLQKQDSPAICPVANCGVNGFQQTFGITINWQLRPAG